MPKARVDGAKGRHKLPEDAHRARARQAHLRERPLGRTRQNRFEFVRMEHRNRHEGASDNYAGRVVSPYPSKHHVLPRSPQRASSIASSA